MVRPTLKKQIPNLQEAIKDVAWKHIAKRGAAALSLRAIARDLRITAPSIYTYFPSRDDLVTALIIDAYTSFGDSQIEARDALPADGLEQRLMAIGLAYRNWALSHPQRYQLIFGKSLPGYVPPIEKVLPSSARSMSALVSVVEALRTAGKLKSAGFPEVSSGHKAEFEMWASFAGQADLLSLSIAVLIWARVHGIVSLEIAQNLPPFGANGDALYRFEMGSISRQFIKE
jgi:AcrR family transcriptional regulator